MLYSIHGHLDSVMGLKYLGLYVWNYGDIALTNFQSNKIVTPF